MDTHTTILKVVIISDEILDLFNFPCFSIFSDLSAASMFSCEMQVGEESTCQPAEKHQNESAADPARRQLPRGPRRKPKCKEPDSCRRNAPGTVEEAGNRSQAAEKDGTRVLRTNCGRRISVVKEWIFF